MHCIAMQCFVMCCCFALCSLLLCFDLLCYVLLCCVKLCYVSLRLRCMQTCMCTCIRMWWWWWWWWWWWYVYMKKYIFVDMILKYSINLETMFCPWSSVFSIFSTWFFFWWSTPAPQGKSTWKMEWWNSQVFGTSCRQSMALQGEPHWKSWLRVPKSGWQKASRTGQDS